MRRLLMLLAWLVCVGGWLRLYTMAIQQLPAAREVRGDGADLGRLRCAGAALLDGDVLYQLCRDARAKKSGRPKLLRLDITLRTASAMALPHGAAGPLRAATRDGDGRLIVRIGGAAGLYRVGLRSVQPLSAARPTRDERVVGLAWVKDHVEWALATGKRCRLADKAKADKAREQAVRCSALPAPPAEEGNESWLALAQWQTRGVRTIWLRAPREAKAGARFELLEGSDNSAPVGRWSHPLSHERTAHDSLRTVAGVLLGARGGLMRAARAALPFVQRGSQWQPLAMPAGYRAGDMVGFDYVLDPSGRGLHALPRVGRLARVRVAADSWLGLGKGVEPPLVRLSPQRKVGPPLLPRFWFGKALRLFPVDNKHGGDLLLLGREGVALARVDKNTLTRSDAPGFFERLALLFRDDCAKRQRDFYGELDWLKMASVPFVLLALPLLFLPFAMLAHRRRLAGRAPGYIPVLVPYLVGTAALAPWFWQLTSFI